MAADHPMNDTDLSNLSPEEAREYVLAFLTTLKQTAAQRIAVTKDLETWRARVALAQQKGAADLAAKAGAVVTGLEQKLSALDSEESELELTVQTLKQNLRRLEAMGRRLVDTDLLQAELDLAVGEEKAAEIRTDKALREAQAQADLEALKKKLGGGS